MPPIPPIIPFIPFMNFCISLNCFMSRLTSATGRPLPLAMRARREPFRMSGLARSWGVIDRMIASMCFMRLGSICDAGIDSFAAPGMSFRSCSRGPIFWTCRIAVRKSSRVKRPLPRAFSASFACSSSSMVAWARSTRPTTSPICRMRPARRCGSAASRSSTPSPTPTNLIGLPVTPRIDRAAPPRASPSIFVRSTPVRPRASSKPWAIFTASCPVMASATSRTSCGFIASFTRRSSSMSVWSIWRRPAVSTSRTWCRPARAASRAATAVATGSPPNVPAWTGTSIWRPRVWSCSMAAGRCRSQAAIIGWRPSRASRFASFAVEVVFPEPCSPTIRITVGGDEAQVSVGRPSPMRFASSSCTIFTICWPGLTDLTTASPVARSCTRDRNSRVTAKFTSASRRTRRTSRSPSRIMGSVSTPRWRSLARALSSLVLSSSNMRGCSGLSVNGPES